MEKTIPQVLRVITIIGIHEDWPLISGHLNLAICESGAGSGSYMHVK